MKPIVGIIDYNICNVGSIYNMLKKLSVESIILSSPKDLDKLTHIILPGVGAFDKGMQNLEGYGFADELKHLLSHSKVPLLGICLGMHFLMDASEEGKKEGLGLIRGQVKRFNFSNNTQNKMKIPHMGWNLVKFNYRNTMNLDDENNKFYFVHSYHAVCNNESNVFATSEHGYSFTSGIIKNNIIGVQFHPEKSHRYGLNFLSKFVKLNRQ
jgi:imidazole glycerol-phosphate synthase subunit HisH